MSLPNELVDRVFMLSDHEDIRNWESYERMNRTTFLKKKDKRLSEAAKTGNLVGVKYLLSEARDEDVDCDYLRDIECLAIEETRHYKNYKLFQENPYNHALRWAAGEGQLEVVQYLVTSGADIHAQEDWALRLAAWNGHLEVVKYLVTSGADIHAKYGWALGGAAERGYLDIVEYLVTSGADIHACNDGAVIHSARRGHLEVVKYLVTRGADIHAQHNWALFWATEGGHLEVVKYLVTRGANVHANHVWLAKHKGYLEVVEYLSNLK